MKAEHYLQKIFMEMSKTIRSKFFLLILALENLNKVGSCQKRSINVIKESRKKTYNMEEFCVGAELVFMA